MHRSHPLYLIICIVLAAGIQWMLIRKLRRGVDATAAKRDEE